MAVTIRDVAKAARVSLATVSRALNESPSVAEGTRRRVAAVAAKLGYVPHEAARSLSRRRTQCIGAVLPDLHGEFFSELIRGIDRAARAHGLHLLLSCSHGDADEVAAALRAMRGRVDGLLVMSPYVDQHVLERNLQPTMPTVLLNSAEGGGRYSAFVVDNHGGAAAMTRHLVGRGHRRIAMIAGPEGNFDARERLAGYADTLGELLPGTQPQVLRGDFSEESGYRAGKRLLSMAERPDAVFAANDMMAIGCLFALSEGGLRVPDDIAVAGFDDIPIARYLSPPLTTVRVRIAELGELALERLVQAIGGEGHGRHVTQTLRTELVVRSSCGRAIQNDGAPRRALRNDEEKKMARKPMARKGLAALVSGIFAVGMLAAVPAMAQLSTSTIRGHVNVGAAPAAAGAQVVARNVATGYMSRTTTGDGGQYSLAGLPPGTYQIEVSGPNFSQKTEQVTVQIGQTAELDIGVGGGGTAARVETITVAGNRLIETKTSEIATQVTTEQMQRLPQVTRNFLSFADLAPGVAFVTNADGSTRLQGGAQGSSAVNIFIDGVSQKNYVLQGGITGQDSSRGNPFPQSAIAEYRVITQNYKAEFDQVSSAAITAVTRSGANEFHVDGFYDHTSEAWRASTPAELKAGKKSDSKQDQYGISLGGPIIKDRMHYFFSYEGKDNKDPKTITLGSGVSPEGAPADIAAQIGPTNAPFKEDLFFGKFDWSIAPDHYLEATYKYRKEKENTSVGGQNTESWSTEKQNDEKRFDLKYQWTTARFMNEAHLTYEDAYWNPRPKTIGNGYIYETGGGGVVLNTGGGSDFQNKGQKGWSVQDDLTWTAFNWNGSHVVKVGGKYKDVQIDAQEIQPYNPQYHYDGAFSLTQPYYVTYGVPLANGFNGTATSKNKQYGFYAQDDWEVNRNLTLNLGLRWDYEDSPSFNDFVTPADVVSALKNWANINNANSGLNINDYISTGSNRSSYKGEWQPRLGFSYDLAGNQRNVIFGGYGRAYDRNLFDYLQLERTKGTFPTVRFNFQGDPNHACDPGPNCVAWDPRYLTAEGRASLAATGAGQGREIDLVANDIKVPYSDQLSIGLRSAWNGGWQTSVSYSYIESKDGFAWLLGNRLSNGAFFGPGSTWGAPFGSPIPGFGNLLLGVSGLETRTNAVFLTAEKPYSRASGWGVTAAYTYSDSKENRQFGEHYSLDYPDIAGYGWKPSSGVPKHRFVGTGIYDLPWWGIETSAKLTLSSHQPKYGTNCLGGFSNCVFDQIITNAYRQLDLAIQKEFALGHGSRVRIRADILNVFNWYNWDGYDTWWGAPGDPNLNLGHPDGSIIGPTRTFKLSLGYTF